MGTTRRRLRRWVRSAGTIRIVSSTRGRDPPLTGENRGCAEGGSLPAAWLDGSRPARCRIGAANRGLVHLADRNRGLHPTSGPRNLARDVKCTLDITCRRRVGGHRHLVDREEPFEFRERGGELVVLEWRDPRGEVAPLRVPYLQERLDMRVQ